MLFTVNQRFFPCRRDDYKLLNPLNNNIHVSHSVVLQVFRLSIVIRQNINLTTNVDVESSGI